MSPDKLFVLMWLLGCIAVAFVMEILKVSGKTSPAKWRVMSALLVTCTTLSAWFGVDGHNGNAYLIFLWVFSGWVLQLVIDMFGMKKLFLKFVNAYLLKHGHAPLEV